MTKEKQMPKKKFEHSQGQRGPVMQFHYDELSKLERAIIDTLAASKTPLEIVEIMEANNWHKIKGGRARGNSRVRNTLRRIVRAEWVGHPKDGETGDGRYRVTTKGRARLRSLAKAQAKAQTSKRTAVAKAA